MVIAFSADMPTSGKIKIALQRNARDSYEELAVAGMDEDVVSDHAMSH